MPSPIPRDEIQLMEHGTRVFELKPSSIVYAAERDVATYTMVRSSPPYAHEPQRYTFLYAHVIHASTAADLIRLALESPTEDWVDSEKISVQRLYRDRDALKAALRHLGAPVPMDPEEGG